MSELIVIGFRDPEEADRVLSKFDRLRSEYLTDEDAVVVVRDETGYVHIKQGSNLAKAGAKDGFLAGGLWGTFVGLLLLDPLLGFAVGSSIGASTGALVGSLTDYGIDDDFIRPLAETFPNNSSGLFLLVRKAQPEKILAELSGVKGKVLRTSLSPEQEKRLQEALSSQPLEAKPGFSVFAIEKIWRQRKQYLAHSEDNPDWEQLAYQRILTESAGHDADRRHS